MISTLYFWECVRYLPLTAGCISRNVWVGNAKFLCHSAKLFDGMLGYAESACDCILRDLFLSKFQNTFHYEFRCHIRPPWNGVQSHKWHERILERIYRYGPFLRQGWCEEVLIHSLPVQIHGIWGVLIVWNIHFFWEYDENLLELLCLHQHLWHKI